VGIDLEDLQLAREEPQHLDKALFGELLPGEALFLGEVSK
jgi:hypothetical protein